MGYKFSQVEILDAAVRAAATSGLSGLTFRLVAEEAGTSDRVVVYYFPDKRLLVSAILERVGATLQTVLAEGWRDAPGPVNRVSVVQAARGVFTDAEHAWVIRLFLEAMGLAVARVEPFASVGPRLLDAWVGWLAGELATGDRARAAATVATIDGLLMTGALLDAPTAGLAWDALIDDARRDEP
jgi:AcrR family transcriptional regulator